jgi:hypothetical protein
MRGREKYRGSATLAPFAAVGWRAATVYRRCILLPVLVMTGRMINATVNG